MERRLPALASVGLLVLLAGCGGGGGGGTSAPGTPSPTPAPADTTPNNFAFTSQANAARGAAVTSNEIVITGVDAATPISISGGEYSINGAAFTSANGTVSNNQRVVVRLTSSAQFSTATTAILTVGGVVATFTATTLSPDTTPDAFQFQRKFDVARDTWASDTVTITGIEVPITVTVENGEYSIDGGAFTAGGGNIGNGQKLTVRARAATGYGRLTHVRVTVGLVVAGFDVMSEMPAYLPDAIAWDGEDAVYLLSNANKLVFEWSLADAHYVNSFAVGRGALQPKLMAWSAEDEHLYLGYDNGVISSLDTAAPSPAETDFATVPLAVHGLAPAGKFLLVQDDSGAWATHYVFGLDGAMTDQKEWNYYSRDYAWDAGSSRLYFLRDSSFPSDLQYEVIDQVTGKIAATGEAPYHGFYDFQVPIRVSADGNDVLLGSGDIYSRPDLEWKRTLTALTDARWSADGSLVELRTANDETALRRLDAGFAPQEQLAFNGTGLRVIGTDSRMAVLLARNGNLEFEIYVPSSDTDGDGVANPQDAFPLDAAASADTDRDGHPDAWNPGKGPADSNGGLTVDAYPNDAACYLPAHGNGTTCNYAARIPAYTPDQIVEGNGVVYLLSTTNGRVYRWSLATAQHLDPYVVGLDRGIETLAPVKMAYSAAHHRLYLGYTNGAVQYIDTQAGRLERPFANTARAIEALVPVGNLLLAADLSINGGAHYLYDSAGILKQPPAGGSQSQDYSWDPNTSRLYFTRDNTSPNDLVYEVIDPVTGAITASGETPYHGAYNIAPPVRASVNGQLVLLGSGDLYRGNDLTWAGSLGAPLIDARWCANGTLVKLTGVGSQSTLRRVAAGAPLNVLEEVAYDGQALRVVGSDAKMAVVLMSASGVVQFRVYVPSDDTDGDGVSNSTDAFPQDRAASVDSDRDGHPDGWNAGRSQADSTTGLTLDSFPNDSACWLPAHGSGGVCNPAATVPDYLTNMVLSHGDVIYLLSPDNHRVYRWSMATGKYLNPYVVGMAEGSETVAPDRMAYSEAHQRLYLGYPSGAIHYIDINAGVGAAEHPFAATAMELGGLAAVGNYVLAEDESGAWESHYIFDVSGTLTDWREWNYFSRTYAWDPVYSRVYFFRDSQSPQDLHYEQIDQATGKIIDAGETPYHGEFSIQPPIHVTPDGNQVILGTGAVFNQSDLRISGGVWANVDVKWKDNLMVLLDTNDEVHIIDAASLDEYASYAHAGAPIHLGIGTTEAWLVQANTTMEFVRLPFYDQDGDGMPKWWEDHYGLNDMNAGDGAGDLDSDGVNNTTEYQKGSDPTVGDTDGDALTDQQEIVTYHTNPAKTDSDGDGLDDRVEVITHTTDPNDPDTDNDDYTDLDEVYYGGNPKNAAVLPVPMTSYTQTFEGALPATWTRAANSWGDWQFDGTAHAGARSLMAPSLGNDQSSGIRFRGYFSAGYLRFWAKVDGDSCCSHVELFIDGQSALYIAPNNAWTQIAAPMTLGIHTVEWRFTKDDYYPTIGGAARIDDVTFGP